mmetsp:Transcript_34676/g.70088  ORF Transcript_34676/g.70088 Transcript_34676/m.70088 type:complete len:117 (+) Transcript_34676:205-555(+)
MATLEMKFLRSDSGAMLSSVDVDFAVDVVAGAKAEVPLAKRQRTETDDDRLYMVNEVFVFVWRIILRVYFCCRRGVGIRRRRRGRAREVLSLWGLWSIELMAGWQFRVESVEYGRY